MVWIFMIFSCYFVVYKAYFLLVNFNRTIRIVYVYFTVYVLFPCLCLV
jgi:hypothetical protein